MARVFPFGLVVAVSASALAAFGAAPCAAAQAVPPYLGNFPDFEAQLTPQQLPGDVDVALKSRLEGEKKFPQVQRLFDLWSWQAFVSLNWPTDASGKRIVEPAAYSTQPPAWTLWTESTRIFLPHGAEPPVCKPGAGLAAAPPANLVLTLARGLQSRIPAGLDKRRVRLLAVTSAVNSNSALAPLSEISQAFSGPIIDQNGNYVYYEILVDQNERDYICQNKLYSVAGQEEFAKTHSAVDLPSGVDTTDASGAFEIKLAWKILTASDEADRYLTEEAQFPTATSGGVYALSPPVKVGLVGMHIAHKSASSKQWIWATFEQVDNLEVDSVAHPNLKPSFFDPNCAICAPNQEPASTGVNSWAKTPKTQIVRSIPIPADKRALNRQAQAALATAKSPLQYYQLIDTQWPTDPSAAPTPWNAGLPGAVNNKSGGNPTPVFLTNVTMETYFQGPTEAACQAEELPIGVVCPVVPWASATAPNNKNTTVDMTPIFGTESCTGCHSSASLHGAKPIVSGVNTLQLTGDFSWLFSQKAE
jgi:hypothetical protein